MAQSDEALYTCNLTVQNMNDHGATLLAKHLVMSSIRDYLKLTARADSLRKRKDSDKWKKEKILEFLESDIAVIGFGEDTDILIEKLQKIEPVRARQLLREYGKHNAPTETKRRTVNA